MRPIDPNIVTDQDFLPSAFTDLSEAQQNMRPAKTNRKLQVTPKNKSPSPEALVPLVI